MRTIKISTIALFVLFFAACSYDTDEAGPIIVHAVKANYREATPTGNIRITSFSKNDNLLTLAVTSDAAPAFYGVAFKLSYDPAVAEFIGFEPGDMFEPSGTPIYGARAINDVQGNIAVGAANKNPAPMVSGNGTIIKLKFKVKAAGSTTLTIYQNVLRDNTFAEVAGVTWSAGTISGE